MSCCLERQRLHRRRRTITTHNTINSRERNNTGRTIGNGDLLCTGEMKGVVDLVVSGGEVESGEPDVDIVVVKVYDGKVVLGVMVVSGGGVVSCEPDVMVEVPGGEVVSGVVVVMVVSSGQVFGVDVVMMLSSGQEDPPPL